MFKIITKLFASDKRFLIGLILIVCLSSQGYSQVKESSDGEQVILPYSQEYLDQYNANLDKKAAEYNSTFRSRSKAEAFNNAQRGGTVGACNLITCGSFEKTDVNGGTFRTAVGGTNGQYQADARYTCWNDDGTVDWSEGQYISYSTTNSNVLYPAIIEPSTFDGGGFAIFSYQNEAIRQTLNVVPNTIYTVCFEIAVIPRYNTVNSNNQGGGVIEYAPNLQFGVRNGAVQISDPLTYTHNDLVQHPLSDFPTRLSFATNGNNGNQNPGGWTEINPYWENRCITFRSGNSATSVEVFYKTGNPGRSVVLVDGLRLSVEGYANAPTLSLTEKTYCVPTQVQLDSFVTSTTPPGAQLRWSANSDLSNPLAVNPTVTTPGIWYAFYFNPTLGCTSPSRKLTLTNTDLNSSYTKVNVTCFGGNNGSIDLSVTGGSGTYTYAWTASNGGSGLNPTAQDQSGLTAGTYNVTVNDGTCTTLETIVINQPNQINVDAGNYGPLCDRINPITLTGTPTDSNGTWTGIGVTNNGNGTASFNPTGLSGTITVTYSYTNGSGCSNSDTADIVINTTPLVDDPSDVTACDSYTLPALTHGNYFTGSEGTGTALSAGYIVETTQTIYVYAETGTTPNCTAENSFLVTINDTPLVDDPSDVTACDSYTLPALTHGNYFTGSGGTGTALSAGYIVETTQTIYVYAETGTTPNCTAENSFLVTINDTPLVDDPSDVTACDSYTLPALTHGNYFTGSGGTGTALSAGYIVETTQTIYVYAETGTTPNCTAENSFLVTINDTPLVDDPSDVTACDSYTLPALTHGNYFTGSGGTGTALSAGYIVETTQTIYVYAETGTTPNCTAENSFLVTINNCGIQLEKIASPNNSQGCTPIAPGESITYTFNVSNPVGNAPINNVELRDPLIDPTNNPLPGPVSGDTSNPGVLDAGETWVYTASFIITQQDIINGQVQNTATVNGLVQTTGNPYPVSTSDSVTVNLCQNAEISIVKSSVSATGDCINFEVDDTIDYKFVVTNEGDVDITDVIVNDTKLGGVIAGPAMGDVNLDGILNVGEVWTYNASYTITQFDIDFGSVVNIATVEGDTALGHRDATSNTVTVLICQSADIAIVKSSDQVPGNNGCVDLAEGDVITYTFTVTNEGNVSIDNVVVADPLVGLSAITGPTGDTGSDGILGLDEIWEYTATYTVTQSDVDAGQVTNQAAVNGLAMNPSNTPVSDDSHPTSTTADGDTVVVICQSADIAIVKSSDQVPGNNGCVDLAEGDVITYTFTVTNEGNVSIDNVVVADPLVGLSAITGPTGDTGSDGILGLDEIWEYTATYTVTQSDVDAGQVTNQAAVNGLARNPSNTPVSDDSHPTSTTADGDTVVVICQSADIAIVKSSDQVPGNNGCVDLAEGDVITYTFTVTNEGNVSIDNVVVADPLVGLSAITGPTGDTGSDGILGLDEIWEYTATYTVTQSDVDAGQVTNQAAVNGLARNPSNTPVSDDSHPTSTTADGDTVVVICQSADIAIVKSSDQVPGNNGCVDLAEGDVITYTFTVTNEGNVSIDNVVVADPLVGLSAITGPTGDTGSDGILGLDEIWEYTATYTVTQSDVDAGQVTNQAAVNGLAMNPSNTPVSDDSHPTSTTADGDTVVVICQSADIAIVKSSDQVPGNNGCVDLAEGDVITYTFTVTNEGNVSIDNVVVADPLVGLSAITGPTGDTGSDGILGLDEIWEYTATYTVTQSDVDAGQVTNQAAVNGLAMNPSNTPVSDDSHPTSTTADGDTVVVICQSADIAIVKSSDQVPGNNGCVDLAEGDVITYTFTVTNEGNVSIDNVVVADPLVGLSAITGPTGDTGSDGILGLDEIWEYTATYTVTQSDVDAGQVTNQAAVNGLARNPSNTPVSDDSHPTSTTADGDTVVVICQSADIAIVKSSDQVPGNNGCVDLAEGDVITYTFTVTNEGNVSIDNVVVADPLVGLSAITGPTGDTGSDGILGLDEIWEYTATYTVTQSDVDAGQVTNQAAVNGLARNPSNTPVSDDSHPTSTTADGDTVVVICQSADIAIVKSSDQVPGNNGCVDLAEGDVITYTFTVTNEGNVSIDNVVVADPLVGLSAITGPTGDTGSDGILGLDEIWEYTATYTVTQSDVDAGQVTNQAAVNGLAMNPSNTPVSDDSHPTSTTADGDTVVVICQSADIAIVKSSDQVPGNNGCVDLAEGDVITYTFTVTNEGNVSIDNVVVADPLVGLSAITGPTGDTGSDGILGLDEIWEYTATYTVTQSDVDAGQVTNQAAVNGLAMNPSNTPVSDDSHPTSTTADGDTVVVICQNPVIAIVKTGVFNDVDGNQCADAGIDTITYTFTVTNEGNVSLSGITVTDPLLQAPNPIVDIVFQGGDTDGDNELDVTETWTYTATSYTITQDDIDTGSVTNQATVTGTAPDQTTVEDLSGTDVTNDNETVIELCQNPVIAIVKTGIFNDENQNDCADVDETISYTFTVTNEGNVSLSNVTVTDPLIATITGPTGDTDSDGELDVTETWVFTGTYVITQDDIDLGLVKNQATAEGTAPDATVVSDLSDESSVLEDDPTIVELCQDPAIAIVKTGIFNDENQNDCADVDETISYTFTVTNEGNVSLSSVEVTDPLLGGPIAGPDSGDTDGDGELDVTETWIYTGNYSITQDDIDAGQVVNQATAKGNDPMGNPVSDLSDESSVLEDDPTIVELCQNPAIAIVKTGIFNDENQNNCADVDETISYTFTVTNEGNVNLSNVTLTDPLIATITGPTGDTDGDGELDVTETWVYTGNYAITQVDIDAGEVINQATAEGTATDATVVTDLSDESSVLEDDPTIIELCQNPVIALIKTGVVDDTNGNGCADVGETIEYSFTVFNLGNVTLSNITVTDPLVSVIGGPITLAPGITDGTSFTASYTITQADIDAGFVENQATATGTDPSGNSVSDLSDDNSEVENDPTITELCQNPAIALIKVGVPNDENGDGCADLGETILYTFSVKNTGNVALTNIIITDPLVTVVGGPIDLIAGEEDTTTFTAVYTITQADVDAGLVENQATAEGIAPNGDVVTDLSDNNSYTEDDPTIVDVCNVVSNPSISLEKTGVFNDEDGNGSANVGETISYTFTVTNTGDVTLYNIVITDPLPGIEIFGGPIAELEPGEVDSTTFTATYTINDQDIGNGEVVNQATVTGEDSEGTIVEDESDDPTDLTNTDNNGDGEPDDPTVVTLPFVLDTTFEIFNGITPNGDGLNDYFQIVGIENWPNNNVKIFNRWGVLVFETNGYGGSDGKQNVFRGISEGRVTVQQNEELPTGTYFYILTFPADNPGKADYTGYLYINR
ncbi:DUF11 domain-containing protein [Aequorivita iocasae]|uniref:DUF11 domain-containing protein n=1 Tax=Aequorivita iocasae TaxID=2803865 RepID=A0ABX7DNC6_9FLAO|nr:gliding motility-associated C-terminal domain-containing protein [Aequorivita iocasae]QQX75568.1 DUF11 domain-containing protein [Aequorivita iocasae]